MTTIDYAELVAKVDLYDRINQVQGKKQHRQAIETMPDYWKINWAIDSIAKEDRDYWMGD